MFESCEPSTAELLEHLLTLPPDSHVLAALAEVDVAALSDVDAVTYLQLHQKVAAWWASRQFAAVLPAASPEPLMREGIVLAMGSEEERTVWIEEWRREELAVALRLSSGAAQDLLDTSRLLAGPLPRTREALRAGEVTDRHVAAIVRAVDRLPGRWQRTLAETAEFSAACAELERRVLPTARRQTVAKTVAAANRAVLVIDAEGERRRREAAKPSRDVWVWEDVDGLAQLGARLSTEHAHALLARIDDLAYADANRPDADPTLTIGERRAHALLAAVLGAGNGQRKRQGGGASRHDGGRGPGHRPAHLPRPRRQRQRSRRTSRCGTGPGGGGPRPARRPRRRGHPAPADHRPDDQAPARLRPHHVPDPPGTARLRDRPGPDLPVPRLPPPRRPLPARSRDTLE